MEVRKLFYEDPHVRNFTANVLCCREEGSGWAVYLDQTAFYPEGGGQVCDTGLLGDARVTDVQEDAYGIRHLCDRALPVGEKVEGRIDWARRFDQMQQHTGEHIVSGIIFVKYGYHNSGFHVGNDGMEVDFDGPIPQADVAWIEQTANEAVWANLPIKCWYPAEELLPSIPYRTKRALPWPVRIVDICGIDLCACCGIHVKHTGEVGLIKISSCVSLRGGVRMVIRCGGRALAHINEVYEQNRQVSQAFSAQMPQTGEAARKMNDALAAEKLRANTLQKQVFSYIAKEYEGRGNVLHFAVALSPGLVRELADAIAGSISGWAAVFSGEGESFSYCLAARSGDLREMGKAMTAALNGRGGGKPNFQQGSVRAERPQIEAFFAALDP
ncbi:MAG: alanyl-tRNA editing protein [Oscillospiraceae bacterium]|nr:alanyl-tRNA editing protein [Oscillospiraceae bacterium]